MAHGSITALVSPTSGAAAAASATSVSAAADKPSSSSSSSASASASSRSFPCSGRPASSSSSAASRFRSAAAPAHPPRCPPPPPPPPPSQPSKQPQQQHHLSPADSLLLPPLSTTLSSPSLSSSSHHTSCTSSLSATTTSSSTSSSPPSARPGLLRSSRSAVSLRNAYNRLRGPFNSSSANTSSPSSAPRPKSSAASPVRPYYHALDTIHSTPPLPFNSTPNVDQLLTSPPKSPTNTAKTSAKAASPPSRAQTAPASPPRPLKQRSLSFRSVMSGAAKNTAAKFFHDKLGSVHHHHPPRSSKSAAPDPKDPDYQRRHEEEKHFICQFDKANQSEPLSPTEIARDPSEKKVGKSSKYLKKSDFKMVSTIGTGTFARVWLAKLAQPQKGDEDKVFALKILRKVDIIKLKQVEHVRNERAVLSAVAGHPFITTMVASFHDNDCLYMIMDYCPGGEIFTYLRRYKKFEEPTAQFYAAEVCMILEFLHDKEGVAYRDLKPENILIDADGHLKLVDFGFAKKLDGRQTWTLCGTPEYLAPETIRSTGHGRAVDWWAFGILVYEFLVGTPPFWDDNPMKLYEQIVKGKINYPTDMSADAKDLISKLCETDPIKRIGNLKGGAKEVRSHPWFKNIDFERLYRREQKGPIIPQLKGHGDTSNFEAYDGEPERRTVYTPDMHKKYDAMFDCF